MEQKAPEKIYLNPLLMEDGESVVRRCTFERQRDSQVEYARTDAFIEKACEYWYQYNRDIVKKGCKAFTVNVEDFKKYMEGV